MAINATSRDAFSIAKYTILGMVKDDQGVPVEGAALHIGREIAYSDSSGHFQVRFSKRGPFAVSVVPDEFMTNALYEVVSAPTEATAQPDETAPEIEVTVRLRAAVK